MSFDDVSMQQYGDTSYGTLIKLYNRQFSQQSTLQVGQRLRVPALLPSHVG